jgi:hypothetical protein
MIAPITARPCYYYRTLVWEWKQRGKNREWVKVAGECMHVPFFVDDNTGRMLVDPRGADLDLHRDFQQEFCDSFFTTKEPAPDNVRSFLARHGIVTNNKIKVEEFCIKPKNSLFILGTLADNPGLELSPRPVREVEAVSSGGPGGFSLSLDSLSISLNAGSGEFQSAFPPSGLGAQPGQVIADPDSGSGHGGSQANEFDAHPPVVLMKGVNNKTFLISWRSQQEVARSLGWKCTLMIWGGPLLALLSLYVFLRTQQLL